MKANQYGDDKKMTEDELFALMKEIDPETKRVPIGIRRLVVKLEERISNNAMNKFDLTDAEIDAIYLFTADQAASAQDKRIVRTFARNIAKYLEDWHVSDPIVPAQVATKNNRE